jgi:hypothetical protein
LVQGCVILVRSHPNFEEVAGGVVVEELVEEIGNVDRRRPANCFWDGWSERVAAHHE